MRIKDVGFPALIAAGVLFSSVHALAHHSAAEYDRDNTFTMKATVTEFRFSNPHPQLYLDTKDDSGAVVHWGIEIGPNPARLVPTGWGKKRSEAALAPGAVTPSRWLLPRSTRISERP